MANSQANYDVVIAGGGLVGGSLAVALAQTDCRVALVEAIPHDSVVQPSFDDRTIALSHGSCRILNGLGLWSDIGDDVWPIRQIHVSEQGRFGTAVIDAEEQGIDALGSVIKSRELGQVLWSHLEALSTITTICPARVTATETKGDKRIVSLQTEAGTETIATRLLVVADGARSELRSALGIASSERDYRQVAVVANVQVAGRYQGNVAYERFTSNGPLAVLPGRNGQYTVVMARDSESAEEVMQLPDNELLELLQQTFGYRLGRLGRIGKRVAYPLSLITADAVTAERAVVIGNAANGLHPVAAQGFNLGLRDVASLAELIADNVGQGEDFDPGSTALLSAYTEWRSGDQAKVVRFTDSLIRSFGIAARPISVARGMGLAAFDLLPGAKRELARQTMGLAGRLSKLARGTRL